MKALLLLFWIALMMLLVGKESPPISGWPLSISLILALALGYIASWLDGKCKP